MSECPTAQPRMNFRRTNDAIEIELRWGDALLASELVASGTRIGGVAARTAAATVPAELAEVCGWREAGDVVLRGGAAGDVRGTEGAWIEQVAGEFRVRARSTRREPIARAWPRPGRLAASMLFAAAMVAGVGALVHTLGQRPSSRAEGERARNKVLIALLSHTASAPAEQPRANAQQAAREISAPVPDATDARTVLGREDSLRETQDPVARGVLSIAAFSAWAQRFRWPDPVPGERALPSTADAARALPFGGLGAVGTGFGAGCADPAHCQIVRSRDLDFSRSRANGARIAAAPMRARTTSPAVRPPDPPGGEITMDYVRHVVRHDLLASVVRCYDERASQVQLPGGRVLVRFSIRADGHVVDPTVVSSAVGDAPTHACIARVLRGYVFPASVAGGSVTYPFVFSSLAPETG